METWLTYRRRMLSGTVLQDTVAVSQVSDGEDSVVTSDGAIVRPSALRKTFGFCNTTAVHSRRRCSCDRVTKH